MPGKYQIMRAIQEGLDGLEVTRSDSDTVWTKAIETKLCEIGQGFGFQVGAKVPETNRDRREWLYDVTWLECDRDGRVIEASLVAECEWKEPREINYDFDKLLLARAGVRLMVYDGNYGAGSKWIAEQLATRVRKFNCSTAEDIWLLAAWERCGPPAEESGEKDWRFRYYTVGMNAILLL